MPVSTGRLAKGLRIGILAVRCWVCGGEVGKVKRRQISGEGDGDEGEDIDAVRCIGRANVFG